MGGFQFGWLEWLSWMFEAALYPTLLAIYCVNFFSRSRYIYHMVYNYVVIWISIVLKIRGIQTVGKWSFILAWFQVLPALWFIIMGNKSHKFIFFLGNLNIPANTTTLEALTMALIFGLWNFSGYAGLAPAAEEIEDTSTNYPKPC
ncbi:MAG: hypothetical protein CM1200mP10_03690 [Candidatus Neomarinimicrobiota bacterium]|nr:MAG: hypothetical protein CM1200mP10_03690 [Candidatus Neomarinimicrobiota bacterium]